MGKAKRKHPRVKRIELKAPETRAFLNRVKDRALVEEDYELIEGTVTTLQCLSQAVEDKAASIKRLMHYIFGAPTETAKKVFPLKDRCGSCGPAICFLLCPVLPGSDAATPRLCP